MGIALQAIEQRGGAQQLRPKPKATLTCDVPGTFVGAAHRERRRARQRTGYHHRHGFGRSAEPQSADHVFRC